MRARMLSSSCGGDGSGKLSDKRNAVRIAGPQRSTTCDGLNFRKSRSEACSSAAWERAKGDGTPAKDPDEANASICGPGLAFAAQLFITGAAEHGKATRSYGGHDDRIAVN